MTPGLEVGRNLGVSKPDVKPTTRVATATLS